AGECAFKRHARLHPEQQRCTCSWPATLDRCLALCGASTDVENRRIKARIGHHDADEELDRGRLVRQTAEKEDVDQSERQPDKRQDQTEEQKLRQGVLATKTRYLQLGNGGLVRQRPLEVEDRKSTRLN